MTTDLKPSNKSFASVFKRPGHGGPVTNRELMHGRLPTWKDRRRPGNTNYDETADDIMSSWDDKQMQRFEVFMSQFYRKMTPWKQEYLDKSAPNFRKQELDILKCKTELIKRIMKIQVVGPESLEDWCLLFLYYDNELDLPANIMQMLRPNTAQLDMYLFGEPLRPTATYSQYYIGPPKGTLKNMSNMPLTGFCVDPRLMRSVQERQSVQPIYRRADTLPRGSKRPDVLYYFPKWSHHHGGNYIMGTPRYNPDAPPRTPWIGRTRAGAFDYRDTQQQRFLDPNEPPIGVVF
jgi:hypothetical protein